MSEYFEQARKILDYSINVFGGDDGGISFVQVRTNLEKCIAKAEEGDPTSKELINIFTKYDKLLKAFSDPINF